MPTASATTLANLTINTIRGLAMDAVQKAGNGHPGMPMGAAAIGYALFRDHLRFDPKRPDWPNRDRFILSAGHGSMLLYSLLYLTGYDLSLDDIEQFRQWGSKTPGHPENGLTPGVEMATGPLGQGFATGVGMAIAEQKLHAEFPEIVNHRTFAICSDGDLMEGVSAEAASLAGHLGLGKLIYIYDCNHVTIDGPTDLAFSEDVRKRFEAYGWHVSNCDGMLVDEVSANIKEAVSAADRPSLIIARTVIGFGAPNKQGRSSAHGAALGEEEVKLAKQALGIPLEPKFFVPDEVLAHMREVGQRHRAESAQTERLLESQPDLARRIRRGLPTGIETRLPKFDKPCATRAASGQLINVLAELMPELIGGSADLAESNNTLIHASGPFEKNSRTGRNLYFGVREHAMGCAINGINLHGGLRAFGGTFLIFSDYMRPAIRLAALMHAPSIFVFTHDSIGLGEDGPTHQPIEHLASLRAIPNLWVFRPADANETRSAWMTALNRTTGPTAIVLTRQSVPILTDDSFSAMKGAHVVSDSIGEPKMILIGTGSELEICFGAKQLLGGAAQHVRIVSMPCWEAFEQQGAEYQESVLPRNVQKRISVEAAATLGWERWVGSAGIAIGLNRFGASAPYKEIYAHLGLTPERVAQEAKRLLES